MQLPIVAAALIGLRVVPESKDSRRLPLDLPGGLLATGGLLAMVYSLIQGNDAGWLSREILGGFGLGAALLAGFVVVELRSRAPMLPLRFFRQRDFSGAVLIIGLVFFAVSATFFFLTQFFQIVQDKSAFTAGSYLLPMAGMMMVGAPISGLLVKRLGPRTMLLAATGMVVFGLAWLTQIDAGSGYGTIVIGLMTFGFGGGMGLAPLTDTVMAAVPVDDAGIGSAVNDVSRELGATLGIAITGSVVSSLYTSNVASSLAGTVPESLVETLSEGIGVAAIAAQSLPADLAATVTAATNLAFVDAFTTGLWISAGFMAAAAVVALLMLPRRMWSQQAGHEAGDALTAAAALPAGAVPAPVEAEVDAA